MGEQDTRLTNYPIPMTIESLGNGEYVISANSSNGSLKINDTLRFDQYNEWEELYRFKSVFKKYFNFSPENGGKMEMAIYSTYTAKKKMSDFAKGLDINLYTINEDFEINIENKKVRTYYSNPIANNIEYSYTTIVPYLNHSIEQEENKEQEVLTSNEHYDRNEVLYFPKLPTEGSKRKSVNESKTDEYSEPDYVPKELVEKDYKKTVLETNIIGNDSIDSNYVLNRLFEGQSYNIENNKVVVWACKDCEKCQFDAITPYMDFGERFPYSKNFTIISGINKYLRGDEKFLLISFSTSNCYPPAIYTTPGILGIALFKKMNNKWSLIYFNPFAAALGSYQYAGNFDQIILLNDDTFLCLMTFTDGGHGLSLVETSLHLFAIQNKSFKHLAEDVNYEFELIPDSYKEYIPIIKWEAKIEFKNNELIIIKEGIVKQENISDLNSNEIEGLPAKNDETHKIYETAKRSSNFKFQIQNKYDLYDSKLIKKSSVTTIFDN
ncbi:MAG TPA: hypothetical protein DHV28_11325 [Ignavibacteriales bacterium]|nr:hypothetical protein [Ignavibacteriales bacterium]